MNGVFKHIIDTAQNEVVTINSKEHLNHLDRLKIMIYGNIYTVFSKLGGKEECQK